MHSARYSSSATSSMMNIPPTFQKAVYSHTTFPLQCGYIAMGYAANRLPQSFKSNTPVDQGVLAAAGYHACRCIASVPIVLIGSIATLTMLASVALLHSIHNIAQILRYPRREGSKVALYSGYQLVSAVSTIGLAVLFAIVYEVQFLTQAQSTYSGLLEDAAEGNFKNSLISRW